MSHVDDTLRDFKCSKPYFEDYLAVNAAYDQAEQMGTTMLFKYGGQIVGFITLAMAHTRSDVQKNINIDTYGNVPALLISYIATHQDYERRGIGRFMVFWAIRTARNLAERVGCRLLILNPKTDVIEFYQKLGFTHIPPDN